MHRVRLSALSLAARSAAAAPLAPLPSAAAAVACSAVSSQSRRCMSAGTKRDNKKGLQERKQGGMRLPDGDHKQVGGKRRYKSARELDWDSQQEDTKDAYAGPTHSNADRKAAHKDYQRDQQQQLEAMEEEQGSLEERRAVEHVRREFAQHQSEREPLRAGEQSWREQQLLRAGIPQQADFKAERIARLTKADEAGKLRSSANPRNPVLVRTRAHLNPADLPPSFDHFSVPVLSAAEIDRNEKKLHAKYWNNYTAWKAARPAEYERWLQRLQKREQEQDFHWQQAQLTASGKKGKKDVVEALDKLHEQAVDELLPAKQRAAFDAAAAADPQLQAAVEKLGKEEVLRRWSAYQVFLEAEIASEQRAVVYEAKRSAQVTREVALSHEDPVFTLNDPKLNLTLEQRKRIYRTLLGAKRNTAAVPFWTDPDPAMEGEHDWKMADAFVKPPLLPPMSHLRSYATRTDTAGNFSSLHRFLHYERLRQTIAFLREHKKKVVREQVRAIRDVPGHFSDLLASKPEAWAHCQEAYPFLSDALLQGFASLHLSPWTHKEQQDFLSSLHRNVLLISRLLDAHFKRRNRNASWILSYPLNRRDNPDEVLKKMSLRNARRVEAQTIGQQLMTALQQEPELAEKLEKEADRQDKKNAVREQRIQEQQDQQQQEQPAADKSAE